MRFLLDMNLPPVMADWLRSEDYDAVHICEIGLADPPDREVFARAAADRRTIVTLDLDFGEIVGLAGPRERRLYCCGSDWLAGIICAGGCRRPLPRWQRR
jgi:predicted nuclease of predicted toxin-antitoxin system